MGCPWEPGGGDDCTVGVSMDRTVGVESWWRRFDWIQQVGARARPRVGHVRAESGPQLGHFSRARRAPPPRFRSPSAPSARPPSAGRNWFRESGAGAGPRLRPSGRAGRARSSSGWREEVRAPGSPASKAVPRLGRSSGHFAGPSPRLDLEITFGVRIERRRRQHGPAPLPAAAAAARWSSEC